jgi:hypothetical protein
MTKITQDNAISSVSAAVQAGTLANLLAWVDSRIEAEVTHRPDVNVHKRTLSETWQQVRGHLASLKSEPAPVVTAWQSTPPPEREMIYAYHPDLVEADFNPSGVVTAWFSDEWRAGIWNGYTDELNIQPIQIAMWRLIDGPSIAQAVQA